MKRDPVDILIQMAFLEGNVTTHGLYEETVLKKKVGDEASKEARRNLIARLEAVLNEKAQAQNVRDTIGSFLKNIRLERSLQPQEISAQVGIGGNIYRMLEEDRISPLKISAASWKNFRLFLGVPMEKLEDMIRRTLQLIVFQPSFKTTLARYKDKKGGGKKADALKRAARELYSKAKLPLPEKDERELSELLKEISA
ncbi:MAG: hypothetical protein HYY49_10110 [Ignavibacteriales bacterium]|nr:hypothetical protein [Ignavibacteriales bacterium]